MYRNKSYSASTQPQLSLVHNSILLWPLNNSRRVIMQFLWTKAVDHHRPKEIRIWVIQQ